jgi:hypothetical protein
MLTKKNEKTEFEILYESYLQGHQIDQIVMGRAMGDALCMLIKKARKDEEEKQRLRGLRKSKWYSRWCSPSQKDDASELERVDLS